MEHCTLQIKLGNLEIFKLLYKQISLSFCSISIRKYSMEEFDDHDKDIAYSRTVKAGKRIYYLDVKKNRNNDLYLSLTESKKKISGNPDNPDVTFEKHKIFLYREDLSKFTEALIDVIRYLKDHDNSQEKEEIAAAGVSEFNKSDIIPINIGDIVDDESPIKLNLGDFE